jgi:hypothetical protein
MSSKFRIATLGAMLLFAFAVPSFAQNQGGGGGGGGNGGGPGGGGNWRQQMEDRMKQALGTTDDEYAALKPKIDKVQQLQRDAMGGMRGGRGFGGRGGRGGDNGGGDQPQSAVQTASADLAKTLDDKDAKPDDIKTKLEALRAAKKAAKEELVKAQDDLKSVLTQYQEARLVQFGMLD